MKNLILITFIVLFFQLNAYSQKVKPVPTSIRTTFKQKFPNIKRVIWDNGNVKEWEAEFRLNGNEYSAIFNLQGKWIKTEHEIDRKEIPSNVKATLAKEFEGYKIVEAQISETSKAKVFEIGLKKDKNNVKVTLDIGGNILKRAPGKGIEYDEFEKDNEE